MLDDIRRGLNLTAGEEAEVRAAAPELEPDVGAWVEAFYARLVLDPAAMAILSDEGRVLRLKRSLEAWFHELFVLPLDAAYARAREEIGRTHLRVGMPAYLMVTAMSGLRADVRASALVRLAANPTRALRIARALEKHLDLELALMLGTYAEAARLAGWRRERDLLLERMARRLASVSRDAVDAALCYAELLRRAEAPEARGRWSARLEAVLARLAQSDARSISAWSALDDRPRRTRLAQVCAGALSDLTGVERARVSVCVEPPDLEFEGRPEPLEHALAELVENALEQEPVGMVDVRAQRALAGGVSLEVGDAGPGWPAGATLEQVLASGRGWGLAYAEHVASLHGGHIELGRSTRGGAAVRLLLAERGRTA